MDDFAQEIARTAESAVDVLQDRSRGPLDFSEASLAFLEDIIAEASDFVPEMPPDRVKNLVQQFGCYIFEVARREFGGRYCWHDERDQPVLLVGEPTFRVALLAWDKVRGRLSGDEADNIPFFYSGFAERARKAEPGDDALYV